MRKSPGWYWLALKRELKPARKKAETNAGFGMMAPFNCGHIIAQERLVYH
jgi:hypothetical protein